MPQLDFREALSTPDEKFFSPAAIVSATAAAVPVDQRGEHFARGFGFTRSTWANIVFVAIASVGGLVCAFYFFNGGELLRGVGLGRIAEINEDIAALVAGMRFRMHAQAPFPKQLPIGRPLGSFSASEPLDCDVRKLLRREIGKERMSIRVLMECACRAEISSSSVRVEWPIV